MATIVDRRFSRDREVAIVADGEIGVETLKHPYADSVIYRELIPVNFDGEMQLIAFSPSFSHGLNPVDIGFIPSQNDLTFKYIKKDFNNVPADHQEVRVTNAPEVTLDKNLVTWRRHVFSLYPEHPLDFESTEVVSPETRNWFIPDDIWSAYSKARRPNEGLGFSREELASQAEAQYGYSHNVSYVNRELTKGDINTILLNVENDWRRQDDVNVRLRDAHLASLGAFVNSVGTTFIKSTFQYIDSHLMPSATPKDRPLLMGSLSRWSNFVPAGFFYSWLIEAMLSSLNIEGEHIVPVGNSRDRGFLAKMKHFDKKGNLVYSHELGKKLQFTSKVHYLYYRAANTRIASILPRKSAPQSSYMKRLLDSNASVATTSYRPLFDELPSIHALFNLCLNAKEKFLPAQDDNLEELLCKISSEIGERQEAIVNFIALHNWNVLGADFRRDIKDLSDFLDSSPNVDPLEDLVCPGKSGYLVTPVQYVRDLFFHKSGLRSLLFKKGTLRVPSNISRLLGYTNQRPSSHYAQMIRERLFRFRPDFDMRMSKEAFESSCDMRGVLTPDKFRDARFPYASVGLFPDYIRSWERWYVGVRLPITGGLNIASASLPELNKVFPKEHWGSLASNIFKLFQSSSPSFRTLDELLIKLVPHHSIKPLSLSRKQRANLEEEGLTPFQIQDWLEEHFVAGRDLNLKRKEQRKLLASVPNSRTLLSSRLVPVLHIPISDCSNSNTLKES